MRSFVKFGCVLTKLFFLKHSCASNLGLWEVLVNSARRLGNKIQKKIEYKKFLEFNGYSLEMLELVMISAKDLHYYFPEATFIIEECTP